MCNLYYKKIKKKCLTLKKPFSIFPSPPPPIIITSTYFHPPPPVYSVIQSTIGFASCTTAPSPTLSIMGDFNSEPHYEDQDIS